MAFTGGIYSRSGVIKTYLVASVGGGGYKGMDMWYKGWYKGEYIVGGLWLYGGFQRIVT